MSKAVDWRCGDIVFLKEGYYWTCPSGYRLSYVYGNNKTEVDKRLGEVKKGQIK